MVDITSTADQHLSHQLTPTEAKVLELLAVGHSNRRICQQLFLAQPTVDYHIARLRRKLNAESRVAIVSRAYALGHLRAPEWPPRVSFNSPEPTA